MLRNRHYCWETSHLDTSALASSSRGRHGGRLGSLPPPLPLPSPLPEVTVVIPHEVVGKGGGEVLVARALSEDSNHEAATLDGETELTYGW